MDLCLKVYVMYIKFGSSALARRNLPDSAESVSIPRRTDVYRSESARPRQINDAIEELKSGRTTTRNRIEHVVPTP